MTKDEEEKQIQSVKGGKGDCEEKKLGAKRRPAHHRVPITLSPRTAGHPNLFRLAPLSRYRRILENQTGQVILICMRAVATMPGEQAVRHGFLFHAHPLG